MEQKKYNMFEFLDLPVVYLLSSCSGPVAYGPHTTPLIVYESKEEAELEMKKSNLLLHMNEVKFIRKS